MIAVVEHGGEVRRHALHAARADRLDAGLLDGVEQRARRRVLRRKPAVDRVAVAGEPKREQVGEAAQIAASRGLGLRGGSGSRAFAPSGPVTSAGLSVEKVISSSGWRASARVQDASARLNGSFGALGLAPGLRLWSA